MHHRVMLIHYTAAGIPWSLEFINACLVHVAISLASSLIAYTCILSKFQCLISLMIRGKKSHCCSDVDNSAVQRTEYLLIKRKIVNYVFGLLSGF